jgi:hypothetical protein
MSNAITSLLMVAFMIAVGMGFAKTAFTSVDAVADSYKQAEQLNLQTTRTGFSVLKAEITTGPVDVFIQNTGQVNLADFSNWDVVVHYYSQTGTYYIQRLPYAGMAVPGPNHWGLISLFTNQDLNQPEVFEPGKLNPGEVARLQINLMPEPGTNTQGWVIISTPSGITASVQFHREGV